MKPSFLFFFFFLFVFSACHNADNEQNIETSEASPSSENPLLKELFSAQTGIDFNNTITEDPDHNYLKFIYMYNGGGVAIGDIDGDGLEDIYFGGNQVQDRLFKNLGAFKFIDITEQAGLGNDVGWSTGISMVDIEGDGDLDIYVCKSASHTDPIARRNLLYINDGKGHFNEQAMKWGLAHEGFSTQAYFFDQDQDGDLDMYLVNHLYRVSTGIEDHWSRQDNLEPVLSDRLFENRGNIFADITEKAGVLNQCWGLSASIGDFNEDGKPDIYVCNDFREGDLLYLNQGKGKFKEELQAHIKHTSQYSMGSDYADLNNDGLPDLMVLDMTPAEHERSKQNMAAMRTDDFWTMVDIGYHHQYMSNMLHLNRGQGRFSDIAQLAGVASTDWSWSTLLADLDNDGWKDIFVTNGIKHDVNDRDYKLNIEERFRSGQAMSFQEVMSAWPSARIPNVAFQNERNGTFKDMSAAWGLNTPRTSNGAAYADLDHDGDLDLIINNMDEQASIFENTSSALGLSISLIGNGGNTKAIGAEVVLKCDGEEQTVNAYPNRGFQSCKGNLLHFALKGDGNKELTIYWPDGLKSKVDIDGNSRFLAIDYARLEKEDGSRISSKAQLYSIAEFYPKLTHHTENFYDDYAMERLIPQKMSGLGPCIVKADINGDGLEDLFLGSSRGSASSTLIQQGNGQFKKVNTALWKSESKYEDIGALFLDFDGDKDEDLLVLTGGNEMALGQKNYPVRLYLNNGKGDLIRTEQFANLDVSGVSAAAADIDGDSDLDLFIGGRQVPGKYGAIPSSYLFENDGGTFKDISSKQHPDLSRIGMVTSASFADMDGDGHQDLVVLGEWMSPTLFLNKGGKLLDKKVLPESSGWWYSLAISDMDGDGDQDLICGNLGLNNKFHASPDQPLEMYEGDVDANGTHEVLLSKIRNGKEIPVRGKDCSSEQVPSLNQKFSTFKAFSQSSLEDIYGKNQLDKLHRTYIDEFASCYFENDGKGNFNKMTLPLEAQYGPLLSIQINDMNGDGKPDILAAGGIYDVENETARYDAGQGNILINQGKGKFKNADEFGAFLPYPIKGMVLLNGKETRLITVENEGPARQIIFK